MAEDIRKMFRTDGVKEFEKVYEKPHCIVLDSEYCSMGRMIAKKACDATGYAYYDAVILLETVKECGITNEMLGAYEDSLRSRVMPVSEVRTEEYLRITEAFDRAVSMALEKGPCLIHDRTTKEFVEAKGYSCLSVLTYGTDLAAKMVRASLSPLYKDLAGNKDALLEKIQEETNIRINYHAGHSDQPWGERNTYDLCLNTDTLGRDFSAKVLAEFMR